MSFALLLLSSTEGWSLPPCPEKGVWNNCFGTYKSDDGTKYVGEWKADQSHGQGTETYANGDKYVGEWKDGKYHGYGIKTYSDGRMEKGIWENHNITFPPLPDNYKKTDRNYSGLIEQNEVRSGSLHDNFDKIDCDKNGGLDADEIKSFFITRKCPSKEVSVVASAKQIATKDNKLYKADLKTPKGSGSFPLVIISHGSGGVGPPYYRWAQTFVKWGFAAIVMDHYGPRGWVRGQRPPGGLDATNWRKADLVSVLKEINSNPKIDTSRITLAGYSAGGALVFAGILDDIAVKKASLSHPIKSGVLFYPYSYACYPATGFEFQPVKIPLIILFGSEDPGLENCFAEQIKKMENTNPPLVYKLYKGAHHAFDIKEIKKKFCRTIKAARDAPYSSYDLCLEYNKEAHQNSIADLKGFLYKHAK